MTWPLIFTRRSALYLHYVISPNPQLIDMRLFSADCYPWPQFLAAAAAVGILPIRRGGITDTEAREVVGDSPNSRQQQ
jgi:hypothetical protein